MSERANGRLDRISTAAFLEALGGKFGVDIILATLALKRGQFVPYGDLIDVIWGDKEDGGPMSPENALAVFVCRLRHEGYRIETVWGRGLRLIKIDDDIPIPRRAGRKASQLNIELTAALRTLRPSQSFFEGRGKRASLRAVINVLARETKVPVTTRSVVEDGKPGIRVWRLER